MAKVYIFGGFMTVLVLTGIAWLIVAKFGQLIFRDKKEKKDVE